MCLKFSKELLPLVILFTEFWKLIHLQVTVKRGNLIRDIYISLQEINE